MRNYINDLYLHELETERLVFDENPAYRRALVCFSTRYDELCNIVDNEICEELYSRCLALADASAQAAFSHGMRLGMALICQMGLSGL